MGHYKGQPMELLCWEKAEWGHHPKEYVSVLVHMPEEALEGYPAVREAYWIDSVEGYYCPSLEEEVKVDYWANMPGGPCHNEG
jgi:hypothetical protein